MQSTTAIEPSGAAVPRLGAVLVVATALLAFGAVALASLPLAHDVPSPRAQARPGQARAGLEALPLGARGVVARALGAHDPRWLAHRVAGGFVLGNRGAVQASFSRRNAVVR